MCKKSNSESTPFNFSDLLPHLHSKIKPEAIDFYVKERVRFKCNRLLMSFNLSNQEREDLRQDFMMALVIAMKKYKPSQVRWKTYINCVLNRRYQHQMRHYNYLKQYLAMAPGSIEDVNLDLLYADDRVSGTYRRGDLKMDVEDVISKMPSNLQNICKYLLSMSPANTARALNVSKSAISRAINQIRVHFTEAGFNKFFLQS